MAPRVSILHLNYYYYFFLTDTRGISEVSNSVQRGFVIVPFYIQEIYLVGTVLNDIRQLISFEFVTQILYLFLTHWGPCHTIFIPQKLRRSVPFAIRYYHSNHIGITLRESTSRLYPIPLVGEQIDQNISLQREMVQECVKRQGAQDRERERERERGREARRIREMLKQG